MAKTHFIIQRADLVRELALISNVVERKTTIPILSNLKIEATEGRLVLTGTDLEVALVCGLAADVKTEGVATLPAKRLLDYVRLLPEGPVEFKFGENNWANITAGRSKTRIAGMGADAFPEVPRGGGDKIRLPLKAFARLVEQTDFAISKEESRFTLNGALLETGAAGCRLIATDGHRMAVAEMAGEYGPQMRTLLPRRAMAELARLAALSTDDAAMIELSDDANHYFLFVGARCLTARKMTGNFPDYERVMPKGGPSNATVNAADFLAALNRAALFSDERSRAIAFRFADNELSLGASVSETAESTESLPAEYTGAPLDIRLNAHYVVDFLGVCGTECVSISMKDAGSAALFSPVGMEGGSYKYVVMPMRS